MLVLYKIFIITISIVEVSKLEEIQQNLPKINFNINCSKNA